MSTALNIDNLQKWLKSLKTASLHITDQHNSIVEEALYYDDLIDYDYSLNNYLEELLQTRPFEFIEIQKRRKNGNKMANVGSKRIKISPTQKKSVVESGVNNVAENGHVGSTQQQPNYNNMHHQQHQFPVYPQQGLSVPAGMQHAEWIKHLTNSERYQEQYQRAEKFEKKYDHEKEKNEQLKAQLLEFTIGEKSKPGFAETIMEVVKSNPEIVSAIASTRTGQQSNQDAIPGLSGASKISEKAKYLISSIAKDAPEDDIIDRVILLVQEYKKGNENFINTMETQYKMLSSQQQN